MSDPSKKFAFITKNRPDYIIEMLKFLKFTDNELKNLTIYCPEGNYNAQYNKEIQNIYSGLGTKYYSASDWIKKNSNIEYNKICIYDDSRNDYLFLVEKVAHELQVQHKESVPVVAKHVDKTHRWDTELSDLYIAPRNNTNSTEKKPTNSNITRESHQQ